MPALKEIGRSGIYVLPAEITRVEAKDARLRGPGDETYPPMVVVVSAGVHSEIRCENYDDALKLAAEIAGWTTDEAEK